MCAAVIVLGGQGVRMGLSTPKQYLPLCGKPVVAWSIEACELSPSVTDIVLVAPPGDKVIEEIVFCGKYGKVRAIVPGGDERQDSVLAGLMAVPKNAEYVLIHDAVRPCVSVPEIERVVAEARRSGAAILAVRSSDTLKTVDSKGFITGTLDRGVIWRAQTPQAFAYDLALRAHESARKAGVRASDDAGLVEGLGCPVAVVEGTGENLKITVKSDLAVAGAILVSRLETREGDAL